MRPNGRDASTTPLSLKTAWWRARSSVPGTSLREAEKVELAYEGWRREQPGPFTDAERAEVLALAQTMPRVWKPSAIGQIAALL